MPVRLSERQLAALVLASVAELRHGNRSALSVGHLSCLRMLAVSLGGTFVANLEASLDLTDLVRHQLPPKGHTGAVETLTEGLGVEVPSPLLKAVTEAATPVASKAERATCVHVFLFHNLICGCSAINSPE